MVTLVGDLWVDYNNNSWDKNFYTEEDANKYSATMINCSDCRDCRNCINCRDCSDCINCRDCSYCSDCSDCINCRDCSDCINCRDCSDCRDFETNPERIVSPTIGSRKSQTSIYWVGGDIQVICGCFCGGLVKFREQVIATHGDNEYGVAYLAWIDRVEKYIKG